MNPTWLAGPLSRPRRVPAEPPTGGELFEVFWIALFLAAGGAIGAYQAWTRTPEELQARPGFAKMRAGLGGLGLVVGLPSLFLYLVVFRITGDESGLLQWFFGALGTVGLVGAGLYFMAYYWVRFPDWLLPPPQRGRGGQWNDPDGRPAR